MRTNGGRLFQTVGAQQENRRDAEFVDVDCVDSRSDADDLRTRDCLYVTVVLIDAAADAVGNVTVTVTNLCVCFCI